jgi:hypothetical protein
VVSGFVEMTHEIARVVQNIWVGQINVWSIDGERNNHLSNEDWVRLVQIHCWRVALLNWLMGD